MYQLRKEIDCMIWHCHGGGCENNGLPGCVNVQCDKYEVYWPTDVPEGLSATVISEVSCALIMEVAGTSEMVAF